MPGPGGLAGTMPGGRWLAVVKRKSTRVDLGEVHTTIGYTFVMEDLINPGGDIGCFIART